MDRTQEILEKISTKDEFSAQGITTAVGGFSPEKLATYLAELEEKIEALQR